MKFFSPSPPTSSSAESGGFFEFWLKNLKYYFWGRKIKNELFLENMYHSLGTNLYIFKRKKYFFYFFVFFTICWKMKPHILKKITTIFWQLRRLPDATFDWFLNFPMTMTYPWLLENCETNQNLHLVVCVIVRLFFFLKSRFWWYCNFTK